MTESSLARQAKHPVSRNSLRELFKKYLQAEDEVPRITWETITTREGLPHRLSAKGTSRLSGDGELAHSSFLWYK